jgi:hypothetical protein
MHHLCYGMVCREQVKDLLPLIRFPLMSLDELLTEVKPTELISDEVLAEEITAKTMRQRSPHFTSAPRGTGANAAPPNQTVIIKGVITSPCSIDTNVAPI